MSSVIAEIAALSHEGRGIARINGKAVFLENALPGETVQFEYTHKRKQFDEGRVIEVITASPERVIPRCPHYGVCGGCSQQHISSDFQIQHKQSVLLENLKHFGKLTPKNILPPLRGPLWGYRHKARLGVKYVDKKQKLLIGFREKKGRYLADLHTCDILHPRVGFELEKLRTLISSLEKYRAIPQIEVAIGDEEIALVFRHLEPLPESDLEKLKIFSQNEKFKIYLQSAGTESVYLLTSENTTLSYSLPEFDLTLFFQPLDFTQINPSINRQLVSLAIQLLDLHASDDVIDFFCGLGNFTLPMTRFAKQVTGVEGSEVMVKRAYKNAEKNKITNVSFYAANLMNSLENVSWKKTYTKVLLDPPRTGALELIQQFPFSAERIVYVSCNPATLARDAACLTQQHGYELKSAGILDMFPHTSHVESIALFERIEGVF